LIKTCICLFSGNSQVKTGAAPQNLTFRSRRQPCYQEKRRAPAFYTTQVWYALEYSGLTALKITTCKYKKGLSIKTPLDRVEFKSSEQASVQPIAPAQF
jgi:hypothetical protein